MTPASWAPLVEGLLEAVLIVDAFDLRVLCANRAAGDLLGIEPATLVGRAVIELAATPEDVYFWEDVAAGAATEILSETLLVRADGTSFHVDRRVSRVSTDGGASVFVVGIADQSAQRRAEDELERLVAELRATLESTADGILVVDLDDRIRSYNQRFAELWDLPAELIQRRDDRAIHAWLLARVIDADGYARQLGSLGRSPLLEATDVIVLVSGRIIERVSLPQYARGRAIGRVYSYRDITQRVADESRLKLAAKVFASSLDAIAISDADHFIVVVNPKCVALSGFAAAELIGRRTLDMLYRPDDVGLAEQLDSGLRQAGYWEGEVWYRRQDGSGCPGLASYVRVHDGEDVPPQHILIFKDLTEKLAANKRIEELAYTDALTGLPNRVLLGQRIDFALKWSHRENKAFAVLFIDLDRFKQINDSLGHVFGDRVLVEAAVRIGNCLRQSDTAARLGGDEFLVLVHDIDTRGAEITAQRILAALAEPFRLDDMSFSITCSIGIAMYPEDGEDADDLIKNADAAMYRVKERGRAGLRFYQRQMNVDLLARMKLDHALRQALASRTLRLHYQPQVDLASGRVVGAEALIRWRDPDLGEIPPGRFIPLAEESGFIVAIGDWVLATAIRQAVVWRDSGLALTIAVNVSALQFQKPNFVDVVATALAEAGLPADLLELELTESILLRDADEALHRLRSLADLGVRLSIDDFGTGYSSLAYLKRFPIGKLKIDRSFISGLPDDESDTAIARAVINLARALRLQVIAEGVENERQRQFLAAAGCDHYQGFLFAPALAADEFVKRALAAGTASSASAIAAPPR